MRIILVDDDSGVIQSLLPILKQMPGHEVQAAVDGDRAFEHATAMGGVDLLITDVVMEPVDGIRLFEHLGTAYPGLRTIFMSGYDLSDYARHTQGHQVLTKPIDTNDFRAAVEREVAACASAAAPRTVAAAGHPSLSAPPSSAAAGASVSATRTHNPAASTRPPGMPAAPGGNGEFELFDPVARAHSIDGESLIGQTLGAYQIVSFLGDGHLGSAYAAVQTSINRTVGLKVLDPDRQKDEALKARFIGDARAKAHVQHPSILSVYEAGEADGRIYYAREYVDGQTLAELQQGGSFVDVPTGLKIIRAAAEGLSYLHVNNIPHSALDASSLYLSADGEPRLANLAIQISEMPSTIETEIQTLGRIMTGILPDAQQLPPPLRVLLGRMVQSPTSGLTGFGQLLQAVKALEPKNVPVEAAKISARDRAAVEAVEAARRQRRKSFWFNIISLTILFAIVVFIILKKFVFSNERRIQAMVEIPAGKYLLSDGRMVEIPEPFWIDKYEVTWAEYHRFLQYLDQHPTSDQDFRHPAMPRFFTHRPEYWDIFYGRAAKGLPVRSIPIDLNCPVVEVRWWDAYAYANWLGRELPTADEWEVAASGGKGLKYPWGDEFDPTKSNTNADYQPKDPGAKGTVDGYNFWNPVDKISGDVSLFGVVGMAGNVAEWTGTWTPDKQLRVVKGGSFAQGDPNLSSKMTQDPSKPEEFIGFRTISRTNPNTAK